MILSLEDIREDDARSLETLLSAFSDDVSRDVIAPVSLVYELPLAKLVPSWARLHETRFSLLFICGSLFVCFNKTKRQFFQPENEP